jgi:thymidylate kinase
MGTFIVFSGLDCSGKSTQIEFLRKEFSDRKKNNLVFWSRGGYTPGFQKLKDLLRYVSGKNLPKPGFTPQRKKALSNPVVRSVWLTIAILDLIFYYSVYLRIKYFLNYNIICDRYIMDTNIDFILAYPQNKTENLLLWKFLKLTAMRPDFHFVSTIPVNETLIRSKNKFEPYPDSPDTLKKRLKLYNKALSLNKKLIFIDGMRDMYEIKKRIFKLVFCN